VFSSFTLDSICLGGFIPSSRFLWDSASLSQLATALGLGTWLAWQKRATQPFSRWTDRLALGIAGCAFVLALISDSLFLSACALVFLVTAPWMSMASREQSQWLPHRMGTRFWGASLHLLSALLLNQLFKTDSWTELHQLTQQAYELPPTTLGLTLFLVLSATACYCIDFTHRLNRFSFSFVPAFFHYICLPIAIGVWAYRVRGVFDMLPLAATLLGSFFATLAFAIGIFLYKETDPRRFSEKMAAMSGVLFTAAIAFLSPALLLLAATLLASTTVYFLNAFEKGSTHPLCALIQASLLSAWPFALFLFHPRMDFSMAPLWVALPYWSASSLLTMCTWRFAVSMQDTEWTSHSKNTYDWILTAVCAGIFGSALFQAGWGPSPTASALSLGTLAVSLACPILAALFGWGLGSHHTWRVDIQPLAVSAGEMTRTQGILSRLGKAAEVLDEDFWNGFWATPFRLLRSLGGFFAFWQDGSTPYYLTLLTLGALLLFWAALKTQVLL
jgi:hypothetical protein